MNHYWFLLKAAWKSFQIIYLGRRIPLYAGLMITERCNLECTYCFTDAPNRRDEMDVSLLKLCNYIDGLAALGCQYITIMGGEPTLRKDLDKIVDYIIAKGMMPEMSTNGYWIKKVPVATLKKLYSVCHSIDGGMVAHDYNRGGGSYYKVMESLEYCKSLGVPIQIRFVITPENMDSIDYMCALATEYGATLSIGEECGLRGSVREKINYRQFWRKVKRLVEQGKPIDRSHVVIDRMIDYPLTFPMNQIFEFSMNFIPNCNMRKGSVYIDHNGWMYPCVPQFGVLGKDTNYQGIQNAWDSLMDIECTSCRSSAGDMKSSFFGGEWGTIWAIIRFMWNKEKQRDAN